MTDAERALLRQDELQLLGLADERLLGTVTILLSRLAAARAGERWIPVTPETMPEYDVDVVLWSAAWGRRTYIGYWRHSEEWIGRQRPEESAPLPNTNPTHWRNLPEPPGELFPVAESETK